MKKIVFFSVAFVSILFASAFTIQKYFNWKIDNEKAEVKFIMEAHGQDLIGSFKSANGEIFFDEKNLPKSFITCKIKVSDINTGIDGRDKHLQDKDWFNAKQFPLITYQSDTVVTENGQYRVDGKMSIKGTTKPTSIPFTFEKTEAGGIFKGVFTMKLSDFDIPKADDADKDELTVRLNIPVKAAN